MTQQSQQPPFKRGDIWSVDFGNPVGHEQGYERPALIVSTRALVNTAQRHGLLTVVPGTKEPQLLPSGELQSMVVKAVSTRHNGLAVDTYFMPRHVKSVSTARFKRHIGSLEPKLLRGIEDWLCYVLDLFRTTK